MSMAKVENKNPFHPRRYPVIRSIVEAGRVSESLTDKVFLRILGEIVRGELSPGDRLKSTQIALDLDVSRTPVAKAFARLSSDGILVQRNNYQAEVAEGADKWLVGLHKLRELIEPEAAAMAAGNVPDIVQHDLWALNRDGKPTSKYDWSAAAKYLDFAIHLTVAEYCENLSLKVAIKKCWSYMWFSIDLVDGCTSALRSEYKEHQEILQAICEGNSDDARESMLEHVRAARMFCPEQLRRSSKK